MAEMYTWCCFTEFVCRFDQLDEAKRRHQQVIEDLKKDYHVHFSSEQASHIGSTCLLFQNLIVEIIFPETIEECQNLDDYSAFSFVTIVDVPWGDKLSDDEEYEIAKVCQRLEIDFEEGIPAVFPSRTHGIVVSASGHEINGCIYN